MGRHLLHLLAFSGLVSVFFAALSDRDRAGQLRLGGMVFGGMVILSLVLAWIMYVFTR